MEQITLFLSTFIIIALAEMGDKTQLLVMTLATKYKIRDVLLGIFLSICFLNVLAVFIGGIITDFLPMELISAAAGITFIIFAFCSLKNIKDEEDKISKYKLPSAAAVFCIFFIAELGDKTQLTVMAISATQSKYTFPVLFGSILGMFISDSLGLLFINSFNKRISKENLNYISAIVFDLFGIITLYRPFVFYFGILEGIVIAVLTFFITITIIILRITTLKKSKKNTA